MLVLRVINLILKMNRQTGYCWVIYNTEWVVARWNNWDIDACWHLMGLSGIWFDPDMKQINETRILNPDEQDLHSSK